MISMLASLAAAVSAPVQSAPTAIRAPVTPVLIQSELRPLPIGRERVEIFDIPDAIVRLARPSLWNAAVRDPVVGIAALIARRTQPRAGPPCGTFRDTIDLTGARRNGFVLVGYDVEALQPPAGYRLRWPAEALAIDTSTLDTPTSDPRRAGQISIRPPVHFRSFGKAMQCTSAYRVSMTLEGPHGRSPFAPVRFPNQR